MEISSGSDTRNPNARRRLYFEDVADLAVQSESTNSGAVPSDVSEFGPSSSGISSASSVEGSRIQKCQEILTDVLEDIGMLHAVGPLRVEMFGTDRLQNSALELKHGLDFRLAQGKNHFYEFDVQFTVVQGLVTAPSGDRSSDFVYLYVRKRAVPLLFVRSGAANKYRWHVWFHCVFAMQYKCGVPSTKHLLIRSSIRDSRWLVLKSELERIFDCFISPANLSSSDLLHIAALQWLACDLQIDPHISVDNSVVSLVIESWDKDGEKKLLITLAVPLTYFSIAMDEVYASKTDKEDNPTVDSKRLWLELFNCIGQPFPVDCRSNIVAISFPGFQITTAGGLQVCEPSKSCCYALLNSLASSLENLCF